MAAGHPILERVPESDGSTHVLATVMGLPLVDGIFPALVLAGALADPAGVLQVGLLVFGGSATLVVVLVDLDGSPRRRARTVLTVGLPLVALAAAEAALAPTIQSALDMVVFERFAGLVLVAVAAKTASARVGDLLPRPSVIVGLGLVASLRPSAAVLAFTPDPGLVASAAAAGAVGVLFALAVAVLRPPLLSVVDVDRFRFGSAIALGLLALSLFAPAFEYAPVAAMAVAAVFAYDPDAGDATATGCRGTAGTDADPTPEAADGLTAATDPDAASDAAPTPGRERCGDPVAGGGRPAPSARD